MAAYNPSGSGNAHIDKTISGLRGAKGNKAHNAKIAEGLRKKKKELTEPLKAAKKAVAKKSTDEGVVPTARGRRAAGVVTPRMMRMQKKG